MTSEAPERTAAPAWTPRQRQVLDLMARGYTNGQIGEALGISLDGAKWHVSEVMGKLGVNSREAAAAYWRQRQRPLRRVARLMRGMVTAPMVLKASLGAGAVAGIVAGGLILVARVVSGDDVLSPEGQTVRAQQLPANGVRDFTVDEATRLAVEIGQERLERATQPGEAGRALVAGRAVRMEDFILRERLFVPLTSTVEFQGKGTVTSGLPSDRWGFAFEIDGVPHPEVSGSLAHVRLQLVIEDGSGTVVSLGTEVSPSQMSLDSPETVRRAAAGDDVSNDAELLVPGDSVPRVFATHEEDLRRMTLSVYGDPADPCLRFDDTAAPDRIGTMCPANNLRGDVLYGLMSGEDLVVGTAATAVASVAAIDAGGNETGVPLRSLPQKYAGPLLVFMGPTPDTGSLELRAADGSVLFVAPLPRMDAPIAPTTNSIRNFGIEAVGPALSDKFDVPDASKDYAFILEFPEDGGQMQLVAECDAGTVTVLQRDGPLAPPDRSIVVRFPEGSTRCAFQMEADDGVRWRLYPK